MAKFFRRVVGQLRWSHWNHPLLSIVPVLVLYDCNHKSNIGLTGWKNVAAACEELQLQHPAPPSNDIMGTAAINFALGAGGAFLSYVWQQRLLLFSDDDEIGFKWYNFNDACNYKTDSENVHEFHITKPDTNALNDPTKFFNKLLEGVYKEAMSDENGREFLSQYIPVISTTLPNKQSDKDITYLINNEQSCEYFSRKLKEYNEAKENNNDWEEMPYFKVTWMANNSNDGKNIEYKKLKDQKFSQQTLQGNGTRVVLMGKVGTGKSTLGNVLLGETSYNGPFKTSSSPFSCTQIIHQQSGFMKGLYKFENLISVVDTPGFCDPNHSDEEFFDGIVQFLKQSHFGVNLFVLTLDILNPRLDAGDYSMIKMLRRIFGDKFCKHLLICFTKCDENHAAWKLNYEDNKGIYKEILSDLLEESKDLIEIIPTSSFDHNLLSLNRIFDKAKELPLYSNDSLKEYKDLKYEDALEKVRKEYETMIEELKQENKVLKKLIEEMRDEHEKFRTDCEKKFQRQQMIIDYGNRRMQ